MKPILHILILISTALYGQSDNQGAAFLKNPTPGLVAIIDDTLRFPLNQMIRLNPGYHQIRVPNPDMRTWQNLDFTAEVNIRSRDTVGVEVHFPQFFNLVTHPFNATVIQKKDTLGLTPLGIGVDRFPTELKIEKPGYETTQVRIDPGTPRSLQISLNEKLGTNPPQFLEKEKKLKIKPWLKYSLAGIGILSGAMAAYYKQAADREYDKYTETLDPVYYHRTNSLDRTSSISFTITQISLISLMVLLIQY